MNQSFFDTASERSGTNSIKWNKGCIESISANPEALPFWVADMDFLPMPEVQEKAKALADNGVFGYPTFPDFSKIATAWLKRKHNWDVAPEDLTYAQGLLHAIGMAINLFTKEGDKILVPSPTYRPFRILCESNHREFGDYPLHYQDGKFSLDKERFDQEASSSSMILFCSPHNPTGIVFTEEELTFVLETGKKYGIPVLSDEIHSDLVHPGSVHIPMGKANEKIGAKTITFMAPSKTFNVAGEHSSIVIFSDKEMMKRFKDLQQGLWVVEPGYLIGELTQVCYEHGLEYNKAMCQYLGANAEFAKSYLKEHVPGVRMVDGHASFVTFLDCSGIYDKVRKEVEAHPDTYKGGEGGGVLSRFFGVKAGIAMNDGGWFGPQYTHFCRFNYGTTRERVVDALAKIEKAVKSLD